MSDGKLLSGQSLQPEQTLVSVGGHARLHYQGDGNLVVYLDGTPFWASHTDGQPAGLLKMRTNGDLVITDPHGNGIAHTDTVGHPGAMVQLQDDGNFVVYEDPTGPLAGQPVWASSVGIFKIEAVEPEPKPAHPEPIVGQLRVIDRMFGDDTGPRIVETYHGGDLFALYCAGKIDTVREVFSQVASAGQHIVRSWVCLNDAGDPNNIWAGPDYIGVGPRHTPDYRGKLVGFANLLSDFGLKWHMDAGGLDAMGTDVERTMFSTWADAMDIAGSDKWAMVLAVNEARDTTDGDYDSSPEHLEMLISIVRSRHPQVLYGLTSYTGTEDLRELGPYNGLKWIGDNNDEHHSPIMVKVPGSPGARNRFLYYHGYRGQNVDDKIRHRVSMALDNAKYFDLFCDGEGCGPWNQNGIPGDPLTHVSAQDNDHEFDDESIAAIHMAQVIGKGIPSYMCSTGVRHYTSPETFPGFRSSPALLRKIPRDAQSGECVHAGRANSPIAPTTNGNGNLGRADSLLMSGGRLVTLFYGERSGEYRYPLRKGLKGVLIHPGTGEETPVDLRAGQTLTINMRWARVFVGHIQ